MSLSPENYRLYKELFSLVACLPAGQREMFHKRYVDVLQGSDNMQMTTMLSRIRVDVLNTMPTFETLTLEHFKLSDAIDARTIGYTSFESADGMRVTLPPGTRIRKSEGPRAIMTFTMDVGENPEITMNVPINLFPEFGIRVAPKKPGA